MRKSREKGRKITIFLCDVRSAQNAGAIMRTADAIGVSKVIFGGYTPGPVDRFGRSRKDFIKASLGAEKNITWHFAPKIEQELVLLRKKGYFLVAVEQSPHSRDYKKVTLPKKPIVVILGNEVNGISKKILNKVDAIVEIPMKGKKESLNVSVSAGVVLYRWFDK